jgi:hypothetical protein
MTGFAFVIGCCFSCGRTFTFNPHKVPSIRVGGEREPICRACMDDLNRRRVRLGMAPEPIQPDAYDPIPEGDL